MPYLATLYSKSLDIFITDCNYPLYDDLADWVQHLPEYYNNAYNVNDFEIISIIKMGV